MTAKEFKVIRTALHLNQKEFARHLGLHPATITHYEKADYPIPRKIELAVKYVKIHLTQSAD